MRLKPGLVIIYIALILNQLLLAQQEPVLVDTSKVLSDSIKMNTELYESSTVADSIIPNPKIDSLILIKQIGISQLNSNSSVIYKDDIDMSDYRFTGDIVSYLPFGFLQDLGNAGQPSEAQFYGLGFSNIGYLQDGIGINNRITNSYDLNHFQTEYIDSLEVLNLTSGFVYNSMNNPVTVNFVTRDSLSPVPYSRFRFYQAPNSEEFVDVIFNALVSKKMNVSFEITNQSTEKRYSNSAYSSWKASARVHYMLSNKINLIGSYDYSKLWQGLNGGVDYDNITVTVTNETRDDILYNTTKAPVFYGLDYYSSERVYYPLRYQINRKHNFSLKALGNFIPNNPTDITFYYQFNLQEFRQNEKKTVDNIPYKFENSKFNNLGISLRQILTFGNFDIDFLGGLENTKVKTDLYNINKTVSSFYTGGKISYSFFDNTIVPSLYLKQLQYDNNNYFGSGLNLDIELVSGFKLFVGNSNFDKPYSVYETKFSGTSKRIDRYTFHTFESGFKFTYPIIKGSLSYFWLENESASYGILKEKSDSLLVRELGIYNSTGKKNSGINLNMNTEYSSILITANCSYMFSEQRGEHDLVPDFTFNGGIYYVDTLFNNNLRLKTGITLKYIGAQRYFLYDHQHNTQIRYQVTSSAPYGELISDSYTKHGYQMDLFLAGKIQNAAIVYLVFENVTGSDYYIAPYYPKQTRGIKVGLSWEFLD